MSKHTHGPWAVSVDHLVNTLLIDSRTVPTGPIAHLFDVENIGRTEREANARLIAAAPEMFELLKRMDQIKGEPNDFDLADWLFDLRALIAKVEGDR